MVDHLTLRLITYSIFAAILTICLVFRATRPNPLLMFFEYESWAFIAALAYYLTMVIMDFLKKFLNKTFDGVVGFMNKKVFKFIWTMTMATCLGYWTCILLNKIRLGNADGYDWYITLTQHVFLQIIMLIDMFLFDHTLETSYLMDVIILSIIYFVYALGFCLTIWAIQGGIGRNHMYDFIRERHDFKYLFIYGMIFYMANLNMYFLHQFLLMQKMHVSFSTTTITSKTEGLYN